MLILSDCIRPIIRVGVPFGTGCHSFGAEPSFTVSGIAGIPDATNAATGNSVAGGSGSQDRQRRSVHSHSGAPIVSRSLGLVL